MAQDETGLHLSRSQFPNSPMGFCGAGKKDDTRSRMSPFEVEKFWERTAPEVMIEVSRDQ